MGIFPNTPYLIFADRQKLKLSKPLLESWRQWTNEAVGNLQAGLDCADWEVFKTESPVWMRIEML